MKKLNITKEFLIKEYVINHKPVNQIAKEFGYGETTIFRYLKKYKIKIRKTSEYTKVRLGNPKNNPFYKDGRSLKTYYCKGGCGREVSADTYLYHGGMCRQCGTLRGKESPHYIDGRSLKKYYCKECAKKGIKTEITWQTAIYSDGLCKVCAGSGERASNYKDGSSFIKHYCIESGCHNEISYENWRTGKRRCRSCSMKELFKDITKHPMWKGGVSYIPYSIEFNSKLKESIRKRDNYECQNCGMTEEEHLIVNGQVLHIHHIDHDKTNCKDTNLITLCLACNVRANYNRDYWQSFYTNKIKEIYVPTKRTSF